jgi:hypothetical protein
MTPRKKQHIQLPRHVPSRSLARSLHRSNQEIDARCMTGDNGPARSTLPSIGEDTFAIPCLLQHGVGVLLQEVRPRLRPLVPVQRGETADIRALEHGALLVQRVPNRLGEDASVGQLGHRGGGELRGVLDEAAVALCLGEFGEAREDDALVVGPGCVSFVFAGRLVDAVVDQVVAVDHTALVDPVPLDLGEVLVVGFLSGRDAVGE